MKDTLQINVDIQKEGAVIFLHGRVDIESSPDLRDNLLAMLQRQTQLETIAIDLAAVSYMDTAGLATLIEGLRIARLRDIAMRLRGPQDRILRLFHATGIGSLFDMGEPTSNFSKTTVS